MNLRSEFAHLFEDPLERLLRQQTIEEKRKIKTPYKVQLDPVYAGCCDMCVDIMSLNFNCPICNTKKASTSIYWDLEERNTQGFYQFHCEECYTHFRTKELSVHKEIIIEVDESQ